jgi:putative zinc ribbon protein
MFGPKGLVCQSCGMPLSRDPLGGGTNADGTRTTEYCSHCYQKGAFAQPDITAQQMQTLVEGKLRTMHVPGFLARRFAKDVPTLRRWKSAATRGSLQRETGTPG